MSRPTGEENQNSSPSLQWQSTWRVTLQGERSEIEQTTQQDVFQPLSLSASFSASRSLGCYESSIWFLSRKESNVTKQVQRGKKVGTGLHVFGPNRSLKNKQEADWRHPELHWGFLKMSDRSCWGFVVRLQKRSSEIWLGLNSTRSTSVKRSQQGTFSFLLLFSFSGAVVLFRYAAHFPTSHFDLFNMLFVTCVVILTLFAVSWRFLFS